MKMIVMAALLAAWESAGLAAGTTIKARSAVKLDTGLVIVPFAVPVAVPVATVRQPSVLYSYRGYAASASSSNIPPAEAARSPADVGAILARHCAACHSGIAAQGRMQMFDEGGQLLVKLPRRWIVEAVEAGRMPQPAEAPRLTPAELDVLRRWSQPPRELVY
jgi:hypothetical protein